MADKSNAELVLQAFKDWGDGRGSFFDIVSPDAVWTIPGTSAHCGTWHGRDVFLSEIAKPFLARFATPFLPTVRRIWVDGETVVVLWDSRSTDRDGKPYANSYVYIMTFQDGLATEVTAFLDMAAFNDVWDRVRPAAA